MLQRKRLFLFPVCFFLIGASSITPASAQFEKLLQNAVTTHSAPPATETPENKLLRIQKNLADARDAFSKLADTESGADPAGIPPDQVAERRQDLDQLIRTLSRNLNLLNSKTDAGNLATAAKEALNNWKGFDEKPPYSILLVDDLADRLDLLQEKKASFQSSISLFERSLDSINKEAPDTEQASRSAAAALSNTEPPLPAAKWQADSAALKYQLLIARAESLRDNLDLLKLQLSTAELNQKLLEKQLRLARNNSQFSDTDLAKLQKSAEDRQLAIRKEIAALKQKQDTAQTAKTRAKTALDKLLAGKPANFTDPEIELAKLRFNAAETRVDVLQFNADNLVGLEGIESYVAIAYQNRRILSENSSREQRAIALRSLTDMRDRLAAWEVVSGNELSSINGDLGQQDKDAAALPATDPRSLALAEQRAALWEKQSFLQRASQTTSSLHRSFERWVQEYTAGQKKSIGAHITDGFSDIWKQIRTVWQTPVSRYTVDSFTGPQDKVVQLGTVIQALLFFGIAYFVAARVSRRLQGVVIRRIDIGEAQANTLRNWLMILVGIGLAITTLNFLSIPLTVFAFFGGALAIGLGFGTQTLIKNFISGIIVLFERKIRVGDIIDLGGLSGTIVEINTRSSVLRGADGKETLVPNSLFLENRITNLTLSNRRVRKLLTINAAYGSSSQQVMTILSECVERHGLILKDPAPVITLENFADAGITFGIYYWTEFNSKTNGDIVASDIRLMVEKRFSEAKIQMPTPTHEYPVVLDQPLHIKIGRKKNTEAAAPPVPPQRELP